MCQAILPKIAFFEILAPLQATGIDKPQHIIYQKKDKLGQNLYIYLLNTLQDSIFRFYATNRHNRHQGHNGLYILTIDFVELLVPLQATGMDKPKHNIYPKKENFIQNTKTHIKHTPHTIRAIALTRLAQAYQSIYIIGL